MDQKSSTTTEQDQIDSINQKQKILQDAVQNDANLTIIAEEPQIYNNDPDQRQNGGYNGLHRQRSSSQVNILDESGRASLLEKSMQEKSSWINHSKSVIAIWYYISGIIYFRLLKMFVIN